MVYSLWITPYLHCLWFMVSGVSSMVIVLWSTRMFYGLHSMFYGLCGLVCVIWFIAYVLCSLFYCLCALIIVLWSLVYDLWSLFYGICSMVYVLWYMFYGLWPVCSMFWSLDCLMFLLIYIPHLIFLLGVLRKHFCKNFIKWDFPKKRILSLVTFSYICSVKQFEKIRNKWFHRNPNIPNLSGVFI